MANAIVARILMVDVFMELPKRSELRRCSADKPFRCRRAPEDEELQLRVVGKPRAAGYE
jgi:hypothetical protein